MKEMATNASRPSTNTRADRHLKAALERVTSGWIPVNEQLLAKVQKGLSDGVYDLDTDFLVAEIKTDIGLFAYCMRELARLVHEGKITKQPHMSPIELLGHAGIEQLKLILTADAGKISKHSLKSVNAVQSARLQECLVSATTAEVLGEKHHIASDFAFSTAVMRQLGVSLIAWNYPNVYRRAVLSLSNNKDLDTEIADALGFSPTLLGIALARSWGLAAEIREGMGDSTGENGPSKSTIGVADQLTKICQVGEALARANNPEYYPSAKADWHFARSEVEHTLGASGLNTIREHLRDTCQHYMLAAPSAFEQIAELQPETRLHQKLAGALRTRNKYLSQCPPHVQSQLQQFYTEIDGRGINRAAVSNLLHIVIPGLGFERGCVYLINPETSQLVPRSRVGKARTTDFSEVSANQQANFHSPITVAFAVNMPIMETRSEGNHQICYIAGAIGDKQKAGVLYLELEKEFAQQSTISPLLIFQAIRQTLIDALNLV